MRLVFALAVCLIVLGLGTGCDAKMTTEAGSANIADTTETTTGTTPASR